MDASQMPQLIQRLLSRMDHLEFRLIRDVQSDAVSAREQLGDIRSVVDRIQKARRLQAEGQEAQAPVPISASHRGPGALVGPPQSSAQEARAVEIAAELLPKTLGNVEAQTLTADLAADAPLYEASDEPSNARSQRRVLRCPNQEQGDLSRGTGAAARHPPGANASNN